MTKMICVSEEEYDLICKAVFSAHTILENVVDSDGYVSDAEDGAYHDLCVAMMKIDDIDARIKE